MQLESLAQRSYRYTFRGFEFDPQTGELRDKQRLTVLQQQPAEILLAMLERPGGLITREELVRRLWPTGTFVDFDRSLNKAVNKLREALQDSADNPQFIETLPRRGYRFIAPVETQISEAPGSTEVRSGASISRAVPSGPPVASRGYGTRTKVVASALVVAVGLLLTLSLSRVRERLLAAPQSAAHPVPCGSSTGKSIDRCRPGLLCRWSDRRVDDRSRKNQCSARDFQNICSCSTKAPRSHCAKSLGS